MHVISRKAGLVMKINDTITAIATSASNAGIGIIRISGSDAVLVADQIGRAHV